MKIDNVIDFLVSQIDGNEFDRDILKYGLEVLVFNTLTLFILIFLTILFKNYLFGFIFIPIFCFLRITIGGFHCKTIYACTLLMITIYSTINYLSKILLFQNILHIISPLLIFLILFIPPCEENTIHLGNHYIFYKYILFIFFSIVFFANYKGIYFTPTFSSLLVVLLMYIIRIAHPKQH